MRYAGLLVLVLLSGCSAPVTEEAVVTPTPLPPGVKIVRAVTVGDLVYLSGNGPLATATRRAYTGKVGTDLTVAEGHAAARATGVALLVELKKEIGDLNKVVVQIRK